MLTVVATVLLSAAFLAIPAMKVANGQENETKSANETKTIDVEGWINTLKENHPTLSGIEQAQDVKDVIEKINAMEAKEAVKDLLALHVLNDLMELKAAQEAE